MFRELVEIAMLLVVTVGLVFIIGCENNAMTGAAVGSLAGTGIGQLAGRDTEATLIGAAVGGGIGYIVGNESDKKEAEAQRYGLADQINTVMVNVENSNGSVVPVKLKKHGVGYVGPRGEYYSKLTDK